MTETVKKEKKVDKKEYLKGRVSYAVKRYWLYFAISIFAVVIPWIKIGGNQVFLLSFVHKKLHLMGIVFDVQDLLPLVFLLLLLFVGIFATTAVGGRVWCGWACPQTIFRVVYRDLIETKLLHLRKKINNKQQKPDMSKPINKIKKLTAVSIWTVLSFLAAADFLWFFIPPAEFLTYIQNPSEHMVLMGFWIGIGLFLVADIVFIKEDFCVYICPYSRVQSVLYDEDTIMAVYDPNRGGDIYQGHGNDREKVYDKVKELRTDNPTSECMTCEKCVTVCPTHIDIRKGLQLECINCLECVDACTTVMGAQGKPTLVNWSSEREIVKQDGKTNFKRPKVIAYMVALAIIILALIMAGSSKENMLLNINKSTRLYKVLDKGVVENDYLFLFQNTDNKKHEYYFEVEGIKGIKIVRPRNSFFLKAGSKKKKVVILSTDKKLIKSNTQDTPIPITIKAYAKDDPKRVVVYRKSVFVYPRLDKLKK